MTIVDLVKTAEKKQSLCVDLIDAIETHKRNDIASDNDNDPELILALRSWINE